MQKMSLNRRRAVIRGNVKGWLLMLPVLFFMGAFTFYPFIKTIVLSFFRKNLQMRNPIFVGLDNYVSAFSNADFIKSALNTVKFSLIVIPLGICLGLMLAYLLNKGVKGTGVFRTLLFYPNVAPVVGFYLVWRYLMSPHIGYINNIFRMINLPTHSWLSEAATALPAISVIYLWRDAGYMMIFFLSGMQSISSSYYEAATLDGAGEWRKFISITFPLLMPTFVFALTMAISGAVKVVDVVAILTQGGPTYSTSMILYHVYKYGFEYWDQGMAATFSVIFLAFALILVVFQNFKLDGITYYEQ